MSDLEKLQDDLLALPVQSRAVLARALIASLDETLDENVEGLWIEEIRRRDADFRSGESTARSAEVVLKEARERLRCMK